ncbi:uncharacterized protein V6R79_012760 [Siganus canaliculatus]
MDGGILFNGSAPEESKGDGQEKNAGVVPRSLGGGEASTPQSPPGMYTDMLLVGERDLLSFGLIIY